jgi:three-Cys-motif partner protein
MASKVKAERFFETTREWQWIKHTILRDYLVPWSFKVGSTAKDIYVVDAFAGAGVYETPAGRSEGSPLIAVHAAVAYAKKRPDKRMHVICIEQNHANHESLVSALSPFVRFATVLRGEFSSHVDTVLGMISDAPTLILLDPFGLKPLQASTCQKLLSRKGKTDVFMVVLFGVAHRTAGQLLPDGAPNPSVHGSTGNCANVDGFFGSDAWRTSSINPTMDTQAREKSWIDLLMTTAVPGGYAYRCAHPVRSRAGGPTKYWIVQLSQSADALWLMYDQVAKVDEMLLQRHYAGDGQIEGLAEEMVRHRRATIDQALAGSIDGFLRDRAGNATFQDVKHGLAAEFFGQAKQGAFARIVKAMVRDGRLVREGSGRAPVDPSETIRLPDTANPAIAHATDSEFVHQPGDQAVA